VDLTLPATSANPESLSSPLAALRVGYGFDVHRWVDEPGRPLVLGGVTFDHQRALRGHSDADVITHCCIDAVLSASGLGDIGQMFSDIDPKWKNANSVELFGQVMTDVTSAGWQVLNIDCTIIADEPKIAPARPQIQANLSAVAGAPVTVKGKTTEKITSLAEGVQGHAVALMVKK